ncbi:acyl-CoA-like ligand-binding transcription factor [Actinokineospora spheciospongiae]|uniref:acyl-CoA-like ligand-binding transcription factor n=1 Tax=Actinokineospora spheciospongiae TaxID=909613 RepID=UPI000D70EAE7|nr:TetR family transcriptional regulator [Actinokineospora spheciospongiae]PWW63493.1 TetR family transcriptional regulator [Actinokineospora spheciospongiae]
MATPATARTEGLRDRKKRETRTALSDAALDLAAERGLDHVTVDDIAERAGVSTRTFFNYFPSKEDAVLIPDDDLGTRIRTMVLNRPRHEPPLTAVREMLLDEIGTADVDHHRWVLRMQVVRQHPDLLNRAFLSGAATEQQLAHALAERLDLPADHTYPRLVAAAAGAAFRVAITRWSTPTDPPVLADVLSEAFHLLERGLPAPTEQP